MSWNKCKKNKPPRTSFHSNLFKVLLTLKQLHGSREGIKGSTLEDISMHMLRDFSLDGDIKSQVLSVLKYGVKMHYIQRKKDKFHLIVPASSVHLAPCKFKEEEIKRVHNIFPQTWQNNACVDSEGRSCCGKRKQSALQVCCPGFSAEDEENEDNDPCRACRANTSKFSVNRKRPRRTPCVTAELPRCARGDKNRKRGRDVAPYDDLCQFCGHEFDDTSAFNFEAHKNCTCCSK